jgi:two-component system, OmpR family, alkaline phosphatase synthesis response regulator PhoP
MPAHALIVEDEPHIRELLELHLRLEGLQVSSCEDGEAALQAIATTTYDLVVLDVMLPKLDGLTVCAAVRRSSLNAETPVLILTARREEADTVLGLETGADDYLTKPFGVREFVARVRALLRRPRRRRRADAASVHADGVRLDRARRLAWVDDRQADLTPHEFDVLFLLVSTPGIVYSREDLLARVWTAETHVTERSVDSLIKRLRQKVERDSAEPTRILTVWGTGYKFTDA